MGNKIWEMSSNFSRLRCMQELSDKLLIDGRAITTDDVVQLQTLLIAMMKRANSEALEAMER